MITRTFAHHSALFIFATCAVTALRCQNLSSQYLLPWENPTIFVAQIDEVNGGSLPAPEPPGIRARALQIVRDNYHQGLTPGEFRASRIQLHEYREYPQELVAAGKRYVVMGRVKGDLGATVDGERTVIIDADSDQAADLFVILGVSAAPVPEQARAAAAIFERATRPLTSYAGWYAAELLAKGSASDTEELAEAVEGATDRTLSRAGRDELIAEGHQRLLGPGNDPPANLLRVYCKLIAQSLLETPDDGNALTTIQSFVLQVWPHLHSVKGGTEAFRANLPAATVAQLRAKISGLVRHGLTDPELLTHARDLLSVLDQQ